MARKNSSDRQLAKLLQENSELLSRLGIELTPEPTVTAAVESFNPQTPDGQKREFTASNVLCEEPREYGQRDPNITRRIELYSVEESLLDEMHLYAASNEVIILHFHPYNEACFASYMCRKWVNYDNRRGQDQGLEIDRKTESPPLIV